MKKKNLFLIRHTYNKMFPKQCSSNIRYDQMVRWRRALLSCRPISLTDCWKPPGSSASLAGWTQESATYGAVSKFHLVKVLRFLNRRNIYEMVYLENLLRKPKWNDHEVIHPFEVNFKFILPVFTVTFYRIDRLVMFSVRVSSVNAYINKIQINTWRTLTEYCISYLLFCRV